MSEVKEVPEIRFAGFTDDWKQRKVSDIANRFDNLRVPVAANLRVPGTTPYYGANGIQDYVDGFTHNGEFVLVAEDGANDLKNYPVKCVNGRIWVNNHAHVLQAKPEIANNKYIAYSISQADIESLLVGGSRAKLNAEIMMGIEFYIPSLPEQEAIGRYFELLDNLITLHQSKHEKLVSLKKAMLEKMFPQNGSNIPEVRFAGFTGPWEQRKLGELCNITTGKLDANAMVSDGQYDFYTSGIDVFKIDVAAFEGPAITIAGNGASVGYMHLADGKFNAYQRTYVLTDFLADRQFLNVAIGNELPNKIQEEVRGSGIPYIVLNMLTDLAIPFPSHEEQYAIGVYFQQLDNLITLHQRKHESLKHIKAALLQKMFV